MKVYWVQHESDCGGVADSSSEFLVDLYANGGEIISGKQYVRWFLAGYSMEWIPPVWMLNLWH